MCAAPLSQVWRDILWQLHDQAVSPAGQRVLRPRACLRTLLRGAHQGHLTWLLLTQLIIVLCVCVCAETTGNFVKVCYDSLPHLNV